MGETEDKKKETENKVFCQISHYKLNDPEPVYSNTKVSLALERSSTGRNTRKVITSLIQREKRVNKLIFV